MDEIVLLRTLAPEAESSDTARAAALQALEANLGRASAAPSAPPVRARRRGVLALAGAGATAAIVAGILVVSSGPSAETAVAKALHETAAIAAADPGSASMPGPGQFLYTRTKQTELQEWAPGVGGGSWGVLLGMKGYPGPEGTFRALNSWQEETWWSPDGPSRNRYFDWAPQFLYGADESHWLDAGSPPTSLFSGEKGGFGPGATIIAQRPGLTDVELDEAAHYRDFSTLPTEPKALRMAIERNPIYGLSAGGKPMPTAQVISELWDVLNKPNTTPELRAAIFGALAELPGIELNREAVDSVGRSGYGLGYEAPASESYGSTTRGFRVEYIFDPETSAVLGRREVITHPELVWSEDVPAGTVLREVAYMETGVVDSTRERPGAGDGEPTATISPYRG